MRRRSSVVDDFVRAVSRDILLGHIEPTQNLPPIRALAEMHGVTVPTAQRAIARLEELGLIDVRHGSGMRVRDPRRSANLAALPYWLDALRADPEDAGRVLADFLDLRALLALELLERVGPVLRSDAARPVFVALEELDGLVRAGAKLSSIVAADLEIASRLLALSPQVAFAALWSSLASLLELMPEVAAAMYQDPRANVLGWRTALEIAASEQDLKTNGRSLIRAMDQLTTQRFVEALER